jgi:hypothetical protein
LTGVFDGAVTWPPDMDLAVAVAARCDLEVIPPA